MKCKDCKWWDNVDTEDCKDTDYEDYGYCRRRSPSIVLGMINMIPEQCGMWPFVYEDAWCGEFTAKKIKPGPGANACDSNQD